MVEQLISGSSMNRRISKWEDVYGSIERYLPNSYTILPMGDPRYGKLNAGTFLGREKHADGLASAPWTVDAGSLSAMGITYEGPGEIPVVDFDGSSDYLRADDNAYWSRDDSGAAPVTFTTWVNLDADTASPTTWSKWNTATGREEYLLQVQEGPKYRLLVSDESSGARDIRTVDSATGAVGQWHMWVVTYDGTGGADPLGGSNCVIYHDGVAVASSAEGSVSGYVAMENDIDRINFGATNTGGNGFINGKVAGGPCGPIFTHTEMSAEEIAALYRIQAAALGVF